MKRNITVLTFQRFYNNKELNVSIAVVDADRNFGLLRRDKFNQSKSSIDSCFKAEISKKLPAVKRAKVSINLKPDSKPLFHSARKKTLSVEWTLKKQL